MTPRKMPVKWSVVVVFAILIGCLFFWEATHLNIETDILESLPHHDPVLASSRSVIKRLPIQDKVFIDLEQSSSDRDKLARAAALLAEHLRQSGVFSRVGVDDEARKFPELFAYVYDHLPILLSASDLERKISPLLTPESVQEAMVQNRRSLEDLGGIGRAEMIAKDPLGLAGVLLKQMSAMSPGGKAQYYNGQLLSADGRHALVIAHIAVSGTDTVQALQIEKALDNGRRMLLSHSELKDHYILTAMGAYRAALDNETIAKRDMQLAVALTTLVIAFLLILAFPRPLLGLWALLPSAVGTVAALFVCSLIFKSISMLAVGFGGAIMAFTVDLGLNYLLFLDQPKRTKGTQAAREVWSAELLAVMTTLGAFLLLLVSDFKILAEIGVFSALGVTFALLFVHFVFPKIFPSMPPSGRRPHPILQKMIQRVTAPAGWKLAAAFVFGLGMLFLAKPVFHIDLQTMNSLKPQTLEAEKKLQTVWGHLSGKCYLLVQARTFDQLQKKNEALQDLLADEIQEERLQSVFLPTALFPSRDQAKKNGEAWRVFWTDQRQNDLRKTMAAQAQKAGFAPNAFEPFWRMIKNPPPQETASADRYFDFLGIHKTSDGYDQLTPVSPGRHYQAEAFFVKLSQSGLADLFDADLFNRKLGEFLKRIFLEIAVIVSIGIVIVVFFFFLDWRLACAVLAPTAFALVSTLGTMKLLGHPLDIPGLMLWIVIMGMGIDYAIYYVCMHQRHPDENSDAMNTVKLGIFLSAATTFVGFGVLALAEHSLLRSIGRVSLLGIGYSLLGTFLIEPALMRKIFAPYPFPTGTVPAGSAEHVHRALTRYRLLPGYPRVFARFKMKMDPMFRELDRFVRHPRRIIDLGCGFGVPAVWLLELYPQAQVYGLDPNEERVRVANRAIGSRGRISTGRAPDLPAVAEAVDYVLMLDMIHYLDDGEFHLVLQRIHEKLEPGGTVLIRATVPSERRIPWKRWLEEWHLKIANIPRRFRSENQISSWMERTGFDVSVQVSSTPGVEEKWFVGKKRKEPTETGEGKGNG
jgi:predicted exporter/ubiquinone/menaquinone biosynthesis C-methylase UbiE